MSVLSSSPRVQHSFDLKFFFLLFGNDDGHRRFGGTMWNSIRMERFDEVDMENVVDRHGSWEIESDRASSSADDFEWSEVLLLKLVGRACCGKVF